jgi:hypothetical protein
LSLSQYQVFDEQPDLDSGAVLRYPSLGQVHDASLNDELHHCGVQIMSQTFNMD